MTDQPISDEAREAAEKEYWALDPLGYHVQALLDSIRRSNAEEMAAITNTLNAAGVPVGSDSEIYSVAQRVECLARISEGWRNALDRTRQQLRARIKELEKSLANRTESAADLEARIGREKEQLMNKRDYEA